MALGNPFSRAVLKIMRKKIAKSSCLSAVFCCCMGEDESGNRKCCRRTSYNNTTILTGDKSQDQKIDDTNKSSHGCCGNRRANSKNRSGRCDCLKCDFDLSVRVTKNKKTDTPSETSVKTDTIHHEISTIMSKNSISLGEPKETEDKIIVPVQSTPNPKIVSRLPSQLSLAAIITPSQPVNTLKPEEKKIYEDIL
jgi:hypothetical protein